MLLTPPLELDAAAVALPPLLVVPHVLAAPLLVPLTYGPAPAPLLRSQAASASVAQAFAVYR